MCTESFRLLALKPGRNGREWFAQVQEMAGKGGRPALLWLGCKVKLDAVEPHRIAAWRLRQKGKQWQAERASAV